MKINNTAKNTIFLLLYCCLVNSALFSQSNRLADPAVQYKKITESFPVPGSSLKFSPSHLSPKTQHTATATIAQKTQTNKCNTAVFMMHMTAAPGEKIELSEIQSLPNGQFIIAGNITTGSKQGFISVMENDGTILQSNLFSVNNQPAELHQMKVRTTGEVVATGCITGTSQAVIIWFDSNLNLIQTRVLSLPATVVKTTIDFNEDGIIAFAAQHGSDVTYMRLDINGNRLWSGSLSIPGVTELAAFTYHSYSYSQLILNCDIAGKKSVLLTGFDQSGNKIDNSKIGNNTDEYLFHDINTFNVRAVAVGVATESSIPVLVRSIFYSSGNIEVEHHYQLPSFLPGYNTAIAGDNAGDIFAASDETNGDLYFIKQFTDYLTPVDHIKQYKVPVGSRVKSVAASFEDGGYIIGLNNFTNNELLFVKVDSSGNISGCNFTTPQVNLKEFIGTKTIDFLQSPVANTISVTAGTAQQSIKQLSSSFDCRTTYCPAEPLTDTCMSSYFKTYRSKNNSQLFLRSLLLRGNNIMTLAGESERILGNENQWTFGMRIFSENGTYKNGVNIYYNNQSFQPFDFVAVDSSHWILGFAKYETARTVFTFMKVNEIFQVDWKVSYEAANNFRFNSSGITGQLLIDQDQNIYYVSTSSEFTKSPKSLVMKMDKNGIQQWTMVYDMQNVNDWFFMNNAVATNTGIVMVVEGIDKNTSLSIDKTTGKLKKIYQYQFSTTGSIYKRPMVFDNDRVLYIGNIDGHVVLAKFDTLGKPLVLKYDNRINSVIRASDYKNNHFYGICDYYDGGKYSFSIFNIDSNLQLQHIKSINSGVYGYPYGMNVSNSGNIYVSGSFFYGTGGYYASSYLAKYDPDGKLGSCTSDMSTSYTSIPIILSEPNVTTSSYPVIPIPVENIFFVSNAVNSNLSAVLCGNDELCQSVKVTGTKLVCNPAQQQTYSATRNNGCSLRPQFVYDTAFVKPGTGVDTAITVSFKKTGKTWIKVLLDAGCNIYSDSIEVEISSSASLPFLGNDTIICPGSSLLLNPGDGFKTYTWQDLSANQTFPVNKGGTYYVSTTNYCGDVAADTIVVKDVFVPPLYLGKDTSVCKNDTISFSLPGFTKYNWVANGDVFQDNQLIRLIVTQNTAFSVKAFTKEGCIAQDTVLVTVFQPQPFFLGNDTAFCDKEQLQLTVPALYKNYWWSTGAAGVNSITITQKGMYAVKTQDVNGCFFSDTLQVTALYTLPSINLGADFDICKGSSRQLDAGVFNKYLWQDGSVSRKITVINPGLYWVIVTDNNGCTGNDSVQLKSVLPVPENFLASVDSVCQYEKKTILPLHTFSSYLWSDGSSQSSLTVQSPGYYSLLVKDINGCNGADSVLIIQKYCRTGIFFPNAFTPNNDGLNDKYMPVIFGPVLKYRLEIFNRYGQRVFETNNHLAGWDGIYNSLEQDPAVFSYTCTYQLEGGVVTTQKGLVTLIR